MAAHQLPRVSELSQREDFRILLCQPVVAERNIIRPAEAPPSSVESAVRCLRRWEDEAVEGVEIRENVESELLASAELGGERNGQSDSCSPPPPLESEVRVRVDMCAEVLTVLSTSMASEAEPPVLILVPSSQSDCVSRQ